MRVQYVSEISNQLPQNLGPALSVGELKAENPPMSFSDYLASHMNDIKAPTMTRNAEMQAVASIWGYYMPLWTLAKSEEKQKTRAIDSLSDL